MTGRTQALHHASAGLDFACWTHPHSACPRIFGVTQARALRPCSGRHAQPQAGSAHARIMLGLCLERRWAGAEPNLPSAQQPSACCHKTSRPAAPAGCGSDRSPVHSEQRRKAPHWYSTCSGWSRRTGPHIDVREAGLQVGLHPVLEARARGVEGRQANAHPSLPGLDRCHGHSLHRSPCQDGLAVDNRLQSRVSTCCRCSRPKQGLCFRRTAAAGCHRT